MADTTDAPDAPLGAVEPALSSPDAHQSESSAADASPSVAGPSAAAVLEAHQEPTERRAPDCQAKGLQTTGRSSEGTPGARRGRSTRAKNVSQNDLVDFVSDRMIALQRQKSRRRMVLAGSIALSVVLLLGAAAGGWYQWGQEYLPLPDSVAEQAPQWMAGMFNRVATAAR